MTESQLIGRHTRRALIRVLLLAFACRALVPAGFMPAPLAEGGPIRVCPSGPAAAFFAALGHRHASHTNHAHPGQAGRPSGAHGHDGRSSEHDAWDHCPTGTAFAHAALVSEYPAFAVERDHAFDRTEPADSATTLLAQPYWARAPPAG